MTLEVSQQRRSVKLEEGWKSFLELEFEKNYMKSLREFLAAEKKKGKVIFPKGENIFRSFDLAPFEDVKVVILGQDPYHGDGQAHGLCFSVEKGVTPPPSLQNIYKEIERDLNIKNSLEGDLSSWAKQGVLLLNSVLTVERNHAASHAGKGWETFTDKVIEVLSEEKENLVFLLWGNYAKTKGKKINRKKHLVLESSHPSPLSFYRGFLGSSHFSKTNEYLKAQGKNEINWCVASS